MSEMMHDAKCPRQNGSRIEIKLKPYKGARAGCVKNPSGEKSYQLAVRILNMEHSSALTLTTLRAWSC